MYFHTQIFGEIALYHQVKISRHLVIEAHENYQKRSARNRYEIITTQGLEVLSIPLQKGKNKQTPIKEVKISYEENWVNKHLQAISSAYGKSPFYEHYMPFVEHLFKKRHEYLYEMNLASLKMIASKIGLPLTIEETTTFQNNYTTPPSFVVAKYEQVFEDKHGFIPSNSILDLLFCKGPESILYI